MKREWKMKKEIEINPIILEKVEEKYIIVNRSGSDCVRYLCNFHGGVPFELYVQVVEKTSNNMSNTLRGSGIPNYFLSLLLKLIYEEKYDEKSVFHFDKIEDASKLLTMLIESNMNNLLKETVRDCEIVSIKSMKSVKMEWYMTYEDSKNA